MLKFGENYKGGQARTICPLCELHDDSQFMTLKCPKIRQELENENEDADINFEANILNDNITRETIDTLKLILKIREKNLL